MLFERGRQRRPGKHRGLGAGNVPPGATERLDHHVAALLVELAVLLDDVLRAVERGAGRRLDRRERAIVQVGFHAGQRGDQLLVAHGKAHAPAGHGKGLGHRSEFHRHVLGAGHFQDGAGGIAVEIEFGIGEVRQDPDLVLLAQATSRS
jgi:hypothetical protein